MCPTQCGCLWISYAVMKSLGQHSGWQPVWLSLSPRDSLVQMKSKIQRFIWNRLCYQGGICLAVQAVKSSEKITLTNLSLQCPLSESTSLSNTYLPQLQGRNPPSAAARVIPEETDTLPACRKDTDSSTEMNITNTINRATIEILKSRAYFFEFVLYII